MGTNIGARAGRPPRGARASRRSKRPRRRTALGAWLEEAVLTIRNRYAGRRRARGAGQTLGQRCGQMLGVAGASPPPQCRGLPARHRVCDSDLLHSCLRPTAAHLESAKARTRIPCAPGAARRSVLCACHWSPTQPGMGRWFGAAHMCVARDQPHVCPVNACVSATQPARRQCPCQQYYVNRAAYSTRPTCTQRRSCLQVTQITRLEHPKATWRWPSSGRIMTRIPRTRSTPAMGASRAAAGGGGRLLGDSPSSTPSLAGSCLSSAKPSR
jgi:hypothetical protein